MIATWNLDAIREHIRIKTTSDLLEREFDASTFRQMIATSDVGSIKPVGNRTIGILLVRPDHDVGQREIIPSLNYFHHRSGCHIDFYCGGYGQHLESPDAKPVIASGPNSQPWAFSDRAFVDFVAELEKESTWAYRGGPELLLLAGRVDPASEDIELDFSYLLAIDLQRAIDDEVVVSTRHLFEDIFRRAKDSGLERMSDTNYAKTFFRGLADHLLEKVPLGIGKAAKKASYFIVHDHSK